MVFSPKLVKNFPRTYEKLHCKGESYRFTNKQDPSVPKDTQTPDILSLLLLIYLKV